MRVISELRIIINYKYDSLVYTLVIAHVRESSLSVAVSCFLHTIAIRKSCLCTFPALPKMYDCKLSLEINVSAIFMHG